MIDGNDDKVSARRNQETARRLQLARLQAGFPSAIEFARHAGVNQTTYYHHEKGLRALLPDAARRYARALGISAHKLLFGDEVASPVVIPVVGTITGEGRTKMKAEREIPESIKISDLSGLISHRVTGDALYPAYRDGDLVMHEELDPDRFDLAAIDGCECIVELEEGGECLLCQVFASDDGTATLVSYSGPPRMRAKLRAAAPVLYVRRSAGVRVAKLLGALSLPLSMLTAAA